MLKILKEIMIGDIWRPSTIRSALFDTEIVRLSSFLSHFVALQQAMHAERDIVLPILSACLSVQCRYCVKTYRYAFDILVAASL